jgi:cytochrome P450
MLTAPFAGTAGSTTPVALAMLVTPLLQHGQQWAEVYRDPALVPGAVGYGAHRCIGEALARAELEESLSAITARIPQLQLDVRPQYARWTQR